MPLSRHGPKRRDLSVVARVPRAVLLRGRIDHAHLGPANRYPLCVPDRLGGDRVPGARSGQGAVPLFMVGETTGARQEMALTLDTDLRGRAGAGTAPELLDGQPSAKAQRSCCVRRERM